MREFEKRVAEYRRQLIEFVRRRLPRSDREKGSDFVQDTLLEAHERAEMLRALTPKQTLAWMVAVLKFKMANASRTRERHNRLQANQRGTGERFSERLLDRSPAPGAVAERNERMRRIKKALAELTDAQRLAIVLRFYAGWTLDEIAHQTGGTRASVFNRIKRGLSHLENSGEFTLADLA
jgi:RNA polymerase sigma-70 factor (ECF subfamily)